MSRELTTEDIQDGKDMLEALFWAVLWLGLLLAVRYTGGSFFGALASATAAVFGLMVLFTLTPPLRHPFKQPNN